MCFSIFLDVEARLADAEILLRLVLSAFAFFSGIDEESSDETEGGPVGVRVVSGAAFVLLMPPRRGGGFVS